MIRVNADLGPITEYLSIAEATARVLSRRGTQATVTEAMGLSAASHFNMFMDERAQAAPKMFHHVYEWGELGQWSGRLWDMILTGSQNRVLTYNWQASNVPVPVGPEVSGVSNDTRNEVHIFEWKAPLMEEGAEVTITPMNSVLAFPHPREDRMIFTPNTIETQLSGEHVGAFQDAWISFFSTMAGELMDQEFVLPMEKSIEKDIGQKVVSGITPSRPTVGINTSAKQDHAPKVEAAVRSFLAGAIRVARFRMGRR